MIVARCISGVKWSGVAGESNPYPYHKVGGFTVSYDPVRSLHVQRLGHSSDAICKL